MNPEEFKTPEQIQQKESLDISEGLLKDEVFAAELANEPAILSSAKAKSQVNQDAIKLEKLRQVRAELPEFKPYVFPIVKGVQLPTDHPSFKLQGDLNNVLGQLHALQTNLSPDNRRIAGSLAQSYIRRAQMLKDLI